MPPKFEIISAFTESITPLSPLSYQHLKKCWSELRAKVSTSDGLTIIRLIHWQDGSEQRWRPVSPVDIPSPFSVRFLTQREIEEEEIVVPGESLNVANFKLTVGRSDGIYWHTLFPTLERFAQYLETAHPAIKRSKICFSQVNRQIIILPFVDWLDR